MSRQSVRQLGSRQTQPIEGAASLYASDFSEQGSVDDNDSAEELCSPFSAAGGDQSLRRGRHAKSDSSSCKSDTCRWSGGTFVYFDKSDASEPSEDDEETMASTFIESLQEKTAEAFYVVKSLYSCSHTSSQQPAGSEKLVQVSAHRPFPLALDILIFIELKSALRHPCSRPFATCVAPR